MPMWISRDFLKLRNGQRVVAEKIPISIRKVAFCLRKHRVPVRTYSLCCAARICVATTEDRRSGPPGLLVRTEGYNRTTRGQ